MWHKQTVTVDSYTFYVAWNFAPDEGIEIDEITVDPFGEDISEMLEVHANKLYLDIINAIDTTDAPEFEER